MRNSPAFVMTNYELDNGELLQDDILVFVPRNPFRIHHDKTRTSRVLLSRHGGRWSLVNKAIARTYKVPKLWRARLYHAVLEDGTNFLLPVTEPRSDGRDWYDSLNQAVELGRKQWVKAIPEEDCYRLDTRNSWKSPSRTCASIPISKPAGCSGQGRNRSLPKRSNRFPSGIG
jgi:hypothetical protein